MNVLARETQISILSALIDGNSERATERLVGANRLTISRLALRLGEGARRLHDRLVRDLACSSVVMDEQWSFIHKKQKRVTETDPSEWGDAYTFVALHKETRLVIAWRVGKRDEKNTDEFMADLRSRLVTMPVLTSDGFPAYIKAVGESFGKDAEYAQTVKNYSRRFPRRDDHRYEPPRDPFITKKSIYGAPNLDTASTAYVERNNGTMRHRIGRMRRLCYAFSKRIEHHRAAASLCYCHYNLCHIVKTLRVTPAMAAGLSDHVWDVEEFFDTIMREPLGEKPVAKPLTYQTPDSTHRELPGGRGFLRVVPVAAGQQEKPPATPATPSETEKKEPGDDPA
jgi:IS1 family transposase